MTERGRQRGTVPLDTLLGRTLQRAGMPHESATAQPVEDGGEAVTACESCRRGIRAADRVDLTGRDRRTGVDRRASFHRWCAEQVRVEQRTERRVRLEAYDNSFQLSCATGFPNWSWNRFENSEFRSRVDARMLRGYEAYNEDRDGSFMACGQTGAGKSALAGAWIRRKHEALRSRVEAGERLRFSFAWISGFELAGARKRSPLGDEAPLVKRAIEVPTLVLDEVGKEPPSEEIFVVLDARYRANKPVIITSPLEPTALMEHLGGGAYRRILEHGALVEAFDQLPKATVRLVR